jgi:CRISPR-associated exonuclease Cas4
MIMTFAEDDLIPISALQHFAYCPRQCALVHIERVWNENRLTAEGRVLHDRVHDLGSESRPGVRVVRGLALRSLRLGLAGVADVVEFYPDSSGVSVPALKGKWRPHPVEYKRGRPKPDRCDEVQLCAQAMCLEEMLETGINDGDIFYGQPRRRQRVEFSDSLRGETELAASLARVLIRGGRTPAAIPGPKCRSCSLRETCLPEVAGSGKSARRYLGQMVSE